MSQELSLELENRVNLFRQKTMGKTLFNKFDVIDDLSGRLDGNRTYKEVSASSEYLKFVLKFMGKMMIPYTGDKLMNEKFKLEREINPKESNKFYFEQTMFYIVKYAAIGIVAGSLIEKVF